MYIYIYIHNTHVPVYTPPATTALLGRAAGGKESSRGGRACRRRISMATAGPRRQDEQPYYGR